MELLLILFCIIVILFLFFYVLKPRKQGINTYNEIINPPYPIEHFNLNNPFQDALFKSNENNLVVNGNFSDGNFGSNFSSAKGDNLIIAFPNPTPSSYVVRQSFNNNYDELYFELKLLVKPNTNYSISTIYATSPDWNYPTMNYRAIFSKNCSPDKDIMEVNPNVETGVGKITEKMRDKNNNWNFNVWNFRVPHHTDNEIRIQIGFVPQKVIGYRYITAVSIKETLAINPNFQVSSNLTCYLNGANINSYPKFGNAWKDLSGNINDFEWTNKPNFFNEKFKIHFNEAVGPQGNLLLKDKVPNPEFTVIFDLESFSNKIDFPPIPIIRINGNQKTAFSVKIPPVEGNVKIILADKEMEIPFYIRAKQRNFFVFTYDGSKVVSYLNKEKVTETKAQKIYFNNTPVLINPDGKFNGEMQYFLFYNKALNPSVVAKVIDDLHKGGKNCGIFKDYDYTIDTPSNVPDNSNQTLKTNSTSLKETQGKNVGCPDVFIRDGEYIVGIDENSTLAEDMRWFGEKSYGKNRQRALYIFQTNFPHCPIPEVMDRTKYKPDMNNCPFIINDINPCSYYECRNTDWRSDTIKMNKKCKDRVNAYCSINYKYDPACKCWDPKNYKCDKCKKFRGQFEDPTHCDFKKHKIEEHPDAKKWIKKDKVPCWGCNL